MRDFDIWMFVCITPCFPSGRLVQLFRQTKLFLWWYANSPDWSISIQQKAKQNSKCHMVYEKLLFRLRHFPHWFSWYFWKWFSFVQTIELYIQLLEQNTRTSIFAIFLCYVGRWSLCIDIQITKKEITKLGDYQTYNWVDISGNNYFGICCK